MKVMKSLVMAALAALSVNTAMAAMQCAPTYQHYQWDRALMGTPMKGQQNNVACLYNKTGNPWLPPQVMHTINGSFKPVDPSNWSGTSAPGSLTCDAGVAGCGFSAVKG